MGTVSDGRGVLHVVTDPRRRGAQTFACDLDAALRARGHRSAVVALTGGGGTAGHDLPALGPGRTHPTTLARLRRRAGAARIVVAHGSTTLDACALALPGSRTPFVYVSIGDPRHWSAGRVRGARVGLLLGRARAVVPISDIGRDVLLERHRLDPARVRMIPNGRDPARFPAPDAAARAAARAALGLPAGAVLLASVGALAPEKRLDIALEAFALLTRATPGITQPPGSLRLVIAGDGPERARLEALADRLVPGLVTFTGSLPDPGPVYRASEAMVLSSDTEGVPGALVEAGLTGIPAAATDVGFVRDVVTEGVTGALAVRRSPRALAAAIRRVLADSGAMGRAAREHCLRRYSLDTVTDEWIRLLDELTPGG